RSKRDWSSDVCSSDLRGHAYPLGLGADFLTCLGGGRHLRAGGSLDGGLAVARVRTEDARRGELAQLVADHLLGDEDRDVLPPVRSEERRVGEGGGCWD